MGGWSLEAVLNPVSPGSFFDEYFETQPLSIHRGKAEYFNDLISTDDIDRVLTTHSMQHPDVRAVRVERTILHQEYCRDDRTIDPDRLLRLHSDGATIILNHLHVWHKPLSELCLSLETAFGAPLQTNIYLTPPDAKGFAAHFDTHDVIVLQVEGAKEWSIYQQAMVLPLEGQAQEVQAVGTGTQINLMPGDVLYIPRGFVHDARSTLHNSSLHITVGILSYTWADVLIEAFAEVLLAEPRYRRALPRDLLASTADSHMTDEFRGLLADIARTAEFESAVKSVRAEFVETRRPWLRGHLKTIQALREITIESELSLRPGLRLWMDMQDGAVIIRGYGKQISVPAHFADAVRYVLSTPRFRVRQLPPDVDDESKVVLVRRLAKEGLLIVASH